MSASHSQRLETCHGKYITISHSTFSVFCNSNTIKIVFLHFLCISIVVSIGAAFRCGHVLCIGHIAA